jgi:hypothetical protein
MYQAIYVYNYKKYCVPRLNIYSVYGIPDYKENNSIHLNRIGINRLPKLADE